MIQNKQRTPGTYMSHAASPHSSLSRLSACSQYLRRLTCDVYLYGSEAEVIIRTFIHKYIAYNRHESVDATLPWTIDIWEHFTAINVPLYSYLCVQSYSMRALPWPSPPRTVNFGLPLCDLSITIRRCCRYFSRRIPPPRGTCPLTVYQSSIRSICRPINDGMPSWPGFACSIN